MFSLFMPKNIILSIAINIISKLNMSTFINSIITYYVIILRTIFFLLFLTLLNLLSSFLIDKDDFAKHLLSMIYYAMINN